MNKQVNERMNESSNATNDQANLERARETDGWKEKGQTKQSKKQTMEIYARRRCAKKLKK